MLVQVDDAIGSYPKSNLALSLLDETVIWKGSSASQVFGEARDMAITADQLGYKRYWITESHNTSDQASSVPELILANLAAYTDRIKLGTSNLQLPTQSALKVVENFRTLQGAYPNRIDLGLILSKGSDLLAAQALHRTHELVNEAEYPEQLADLLAFLADSYSTSRGRIMASPDISTLIGVWMDGAENGAHYATENGLGLVYDYRTNPLAAGEVLRAYRKFFKPSVSMPEPRSILIVPIICAETDEESQWLARPLDLWKIRKEQGIMLPPPSLEEAEGYRFTAQEEEIKATLRAGSIIGNVSLVASKLSKLAQAAAVDEVMISLLYPDQNSRLRTIKRLAEEFQLQLQRTEGVNPNV